MKTISILLSLVCLSASLARAGGESGNGRSFRIVQNPSTGEITYIEDSDLYHARTVLGIEVRDIASEADGIAQVVTALSALDVDFSLYFNDALSLTQTPVKVFGEDFLALGSSPTTYTPPSFGNDSLVQAAQTETLSGTLEVFPIFDHPKLGVASKAATKIQGAIYVLTRKFLPSPNSALASELMVQLMAKSVNQSEVLRLTHEIFPDSLRTLLRFSIAPR